MKNDVMFSVYSCLYQISIENTNIYEHILPNYLKGHV